MLKLWVHLTRSCRLCGVRNWPTKCPRSPVQEAEGRIGRWSGFQRILRLPENETEAKHLTENGLSSHPLMNRSRSISTVTT